MEKYIKKLTMDSSIYSEDNLKKAQILENEKPSTRENILYFKEEELKALKNGYTSGDFKEFLETLSAKFARRSLLEYLPAQRHPIPYCIITCGDKLLISKRGAGSGEKRLVGKFALLGGHIDYADFVASEKYVCKADVYKTIKKGMFRELYEEAGIEEENVSNVTNMGIIKIVNDNVENDHLGLIYIVDVIDMGVVDIKEQGVLTGEWIDANIVLNEIDKFEAWGQIALSEYKKLREKK